MRNPRGSFMTSCRNLDLLFATYNQGKVREVQDAFDSLPVSLRFLGEFADVSPVSEVGQTYQVNAALKAIGYAKQTGLFALADDSGLEVDALEGRPGVFSARFGGENAADDDRIQILLSQLSEQSNSTRNARFVCCMAFAGWLSGVASHRIEEPSLLTVIEASCEGTIALAPRGVNGFGFDPVFVPAGYEQTFGELPTKIKARISHRAKALADIRTFITQWIATA
jgi:XTP/dITP diphosphohydrolase